MAYFCVEEAKFRRRETPKGKGPSMTFLDLFPIVVGVIFGLLGIKIYGYARLPSSSIVNFAISKPLWRVLLLGGALTCFSFLLLSMFVYLTISLASDFGSQTFLFRSPNTKSFPTGKYSNVSLLFFAAGCLTLWGSIFLASLSTMILRIRGPQRNS